MKHLKLSILTLSVIAAVSVSNVQAEDDNETYLERLQILGSNQKLRKETGSATLIDEVQLEKFNFDDIARILYNVPGVNIREEDGFGLRPNIGIRGATPERSRKINILEDGVLIGPAPYSAPSAYYFPMLPKMTAVEVFKGPGAIKFGPNTVAGTVNLVTRNIPEDSEGMIDVSVGTDGFRKTHGFYGNTNGSFGYLLEAVNVASDGFKELDGGGDTGFDKNDVMLKLRYNLDSSSYSQVFELKLGYTDEVSDETYLGLTDEDFAKNPNRRYRASHLANMDWKHSQIQFNHFIQGDNFDVTTKIYRNDFERAWFKLNGFSNVGLANPVSLQDILANPTDDQYAGLYNILTGQADSVRENEKLLLGNNDREYYTQGIQSDLVYSFEMAGLKHKLETGFRFHQDEIQRFHTEEGYLMQSGSLVADGAGAQPTSTNVEEADALSVYIQDTVSWQNLDATFGVRGEFIDTHYQDKSVGNEDRYIDKTTRIWLPSFSVFYTLDENTGFLFGVHEGFIPTSPQQDPNIDIENSVNYEIGGRYNDGNSHFEAIYFFNDISNLKESCGFSNCGINTTIEFNGGEVDVYGLEVNAGHTFNLANGWELPVSVVYTYTESEFKTAFNSDFDFWGEIEAGDELPYLPENQLTLNVGLLSDNWEVNVIARYIDEMLEASGDNLSLTGVTTEALTVVDLSASYHINDNGKLYFKLDNVFDEQEIVSRRPFGARPSKAQQFFAGYQYSF